MNAGAMQQLITESRIVYDDATLDTLNKLNEFQLEGRYPGELLI